MLEDSEDSFNDVERYASPPDIHCSLPGLAYPQIKEDASRIYAEARRLESEVRDHMQLEVGKLSLEESRKSIELSIIRYLKEKEFSLYVKYENPTSAD